MVDELQTKNEEIEGQLQESKAQIANGTSKMAFLNKKIEELTKKNQVSDMKTEELEGKVEELATYQTKLVSDLEKFKSTDADLVISQQETKECNEELEGEANKNFPCESDKNVKFRHLQIIGRIKIVIFSQPEARSRMSK